jgi:hypothetical protein
LSLKNRQIAPHHRANKKVATALEGGLRVVEPTGLKATEPEGFDMCHEKRQTVADYLQPGSCGAPAVGAPAEDAD